MEKGRYLTPERVQEYASNSKQTPTHSLVVYGRQNIINSKARSIFQRKSAPDHLFKYHLQVVYFVPIKTNKSSSWEIWLGGARAASGTVDNFLIDRMVCQDSQRGKLNLSMAWVDFRKAFDAVDHRWLGELFELHRFTRLGVVIRQLSNRWNTTRIVVKRR